MALAQTWEWATAASATQRVGFLREHCAGFTGPAALRLRGGMPGSPAPRAESGGGVLEEAERVMAVAKARLKASSPPQSLADRQRAGVSCRLRQSWCKELPCASATHATSSTSLSFWQMDAHEKQRRALLADAYAKASQDQGEEEDDMEAVMESLEELARTMAQFKELTKQQQERIERFVQLARLAAFLPSWQSIPDV